MEKLAILIKKMMDLFGAGQFEATSKEKNNVIDTMMHWLKHRNDKMETITDIKIGSVYLFSFGINLLPCMSYYHMGIVVRKSKKYLYVLPITTCVDERHKDAFHRNSSHNILNEFHLMKSEEFDFLEHDSVIKPTDIRCLSILNIIKYKGSVDTSAQFFKDLEFVMKRTLFNEDMFKMERMNDKFLRLLDEELINDNIIVLKDEMFNLNKYMRNVHGKVSNIDKINFDTTNEGVYTYGLEITDEFGNCIQKQLKLRVVDLSKTKNSIPDKIHNN